MSVAAGVGWSSPDSPPPASRTGQTAVQISHRQSAIQFNKCPLHFTRRSWSRVPHNYKCADAASERCRWRRHYLTIKERRQQSLFLPLLLHHFAWNNYNFTLMNGWVDQTKLVKKDKKNAGKKQLPHLSRRPHLNQTRMRIHQNFFHFYLALRVGGKKRKQNRRIWNGAVGLCVCTWICQSKPLQRHRGPSPASSPARVNAASAVWVLSWNRRLFLAVYATYILSISFFESVQYDTTTSLSCSCSRGWNYFNW